MKLKFNKVRNDPWDNVFRIRYTFFTGKLYASTYYIYAFLTHKKGVFKFRAYLGHNFNYIPLSEPLDTFKEAYIHCQVHLDNLLKETGIKAGE